MVKHSIAYSIGMLSIASGIGAVTYYYEILGYLYYVLVGWGILSGIGLTVVYKMLNCVESVRIPLNVVHVNRQIDLWRGKLCAAQHDDDVEEESMAMIHIDVYQDLLVAHGLEPLPRVK